MTRQPDAAYFRTQAERCRRLARGADYTTALSLNDMAGDYEAMALSIIQAQERLTGFVRDVIVKNGAARN
jgi:hypothetical protein